MGVIVVCFSHCSRAPSPRARAPALEGSLSSRGPRAPVRCPLSASSEFAQGFGDHPRVVAFEVITIGSGIWVVLICPIGVFGHCVERKRTDGIGARRPRIHLLAVAVRI